MSEDNNSPMADALEAMLPVQQRTMLQATLAGCEIIGCVGPSRKVWKEEHGGYLKVNSTVYIACLPNGNALHGEEGMLFYDDMYEAACAAVAHMERSEREVTDPPGFKLNEGNEQ